MGLGAWIDHAPLIEMVSVAVKAHFDVHTVGDIDPHELPECTLIGIKVDEPLVDAHLPVIPGFTSLSVRAFPAGDPEFLGGKGNGAAYGHSGPLRYGLDLTAYVIDLQRVGSA